MVVEGPKSWDEFDKRGNLGDEHTKDWNKNVAPYMSDKYSSVYSEYMEDLSTVPLASFTHKLLSHMCFPNPVYQQWLKMC
jgi:hypothetical protein